MRTLRSSPFHSRGDWSHQTCISWSSSSPGGTKDSSHGCSKGRQARAEPVDGRTERGLLADAGFVFLSLFEQAGGVGFEGLTAYFREVGELRRAGERGTGGSFSTSTPFY